MILAVTRNATLDEFDADADTEDRSDPIVPVQRWSPEASSCPRCGRRIHERWEDGAIGGVCSSCKEW